MKHVARTGIRGGVVAGLAAVLLAGCASPASQYEARMREVDAALASGQITPEEHQVLANEAFARRHQGENAMAGTLSTMRREQSVNQQAQLQGQTLRPQLPASR